MNIFYKEYIDYIARHGYLTHDEFIFQRKLINIYKQSEDDYTQHILYYYHNSPVKCSNYDIIDDKFVKEILKTDMQKFIDKVYILWSMQDDSKSGAE